MSEINASEKDKASYKSNFDDSQSLFVIKIILLKKLSS